MGTAKAASVGAENGRTESSRTPFPLASRLYRLRLDAIHRVASDVAHDHRNALASIVYAVETLIEEGTDLSLEDRNACLCDIQNAARRLDDLINDMLNFGANHRRRSEPIEVVRLFDHLTSLLRRRFRQSRHELIVDVESPRLAFEGVLPVVSHAILNAVDNALEAPSTTRIRLAACEARDRHGSQRVRLIVRDDGPGIEDAIRDRVFDPFFTTRSNAAGLGLTLAREGVATIGGEVHLLDVGDGTAVAFDFPPAQPRAEVRPA